MTPLLSLHREVCYIGASPCCSGNILLKKKGELLPLYPYLEECMLAYVLPRLLPQHKSVIMGWCVEKVLPKKITSYKTSRTDPETFLSFLGLPSQASMCRPLKW